MDAKTVEEWQRLKGLEAWKFGAAKAAQRWGYGKTLTEAEFDAAIVEALGAKMTSGVQLTLTGPPTAVDLDDSKKPVTVEATTDAEAAARATPPPPPHGA